MEAPRLRVLNGEPSWSLHRTLSDLGERTAAQFAELHRAPTAERAERLAIELEGCRQHVLRYYQSLVQESTGERDDQ